MASKPTIEELPLSGLSRWEQIAQFIPVSRETWRKLVKAGKAPRGKHLTQRCTFYDNAEIRRWIADPASYRAS